MSNERTETAELLIAVDGGGTKTDVVAADLHGNELTSTRVGASNHERLGMSAAADVLVGAIDHLLDELGASSQDVRVAVLGLAGIDWASDEPAMVAALRDRGLTLPVVVVNDSEIVLRAGCLDGWGIVSSAGTESVTAGINRAGRRFRTMAVGWGEPQGARSMVHAALSAVASEYHRTGPPTRLTGLFLDALEHDSVPRLFEAITRRGLDVGPHLAPLLNRATDDGDLVAREILELEGAKHADTVVGVADHLSMKDEPFDLVTAGSVHDNGGPFRATFEQYVLERCPQARLTPLETRPVDGAVLLAVDAARQPHSGHIHGHPDATTPSTSPLTRRP